MSDERARPDIGEFKLWIATRYDTDEEDNAEVRDAFQKLLDYIEQLEAENAALREEQRHQQLVKTIKGKR